MQRQLEAFQKQRPEWTPFERCSGFRRLVEFVWNVDGDSHGAPQSRNLAQRYLCGVADACATAIWPVLGMDPAPTRGMTVLGRG